MCPRIAQVLIIVLIKGDQPKRGAPHIFGQKGEPPNCKRLRAGIVEGSRAGRHAFMVVHDKNDL